MQGNWNISEKTVYTPLNTFCSQ